ncbi:hypothetical protein T459_19564 [Capsicum annuum]|uniref:Uncharacterized protein n=1 Tax=Capsicum annuum TaxID=4072 RepID=A0A2G2Z1Z3_CAPAN|nr:hypothetical protein T459_19564 [Capsicum annuum]
MLSMIYLGGKLYVLHNMGRNTRESGFSKDSSPSHIEVGVEERGLRAAVFGENYFGFGITDSLARLAAKFIKSGSDSDTVGLVDLCKEGCLRNEAQCLSARQLRGHGVKRKAFEHQIPYVESATYVAYNNEKGRVICSLIKHGFIDLDSQVRGIPEWISAKAMVDSWLADATIYELWIYRNANDAFSALSTRLGEQAYFFDNRPISLGAVFFGHALFTLCALPVSDMGANLGVGSFMFKISRLGYESGYGYGCGASTKNDSNIYKWSYHEVTKVVPVNQPPKAK